MKGRQPHNKPEIWIAPAMLALTVIMLDQVTKAWAIANLGPEPRSHEIALIGDWFSLRYIRNTGVAFGLFQHMPQVFTVTSILITIAAIYAYRYHLPSQNRWIQICLGFIVGGAVGNIIDRVRLGYVVDFVRVGWWPVFNMADSAVTVGVTMLASYLILVGDERPVQTMPHDDRLLADLLNHDPDR